MRANLKESVEVTLYEPVTYKLPSGEMTTLSSVKVARPRENKTRILAAMARAKSGGSEAEEIAIRALSLGCCPDLNPGIYDKLCFEDGAQIMAAVNEVVDVDFLSRMAGQE
jgi:hypothetical protein